MIGMHNDRAFGTIHRYMGIHQKSITQALTRLSSGKRINSAADDPAGLGISQRMRTKIHAMEMQARNNAIEMNAQKTAEGGMDGVQSILQRMKDLALQASNGTYSDADRAAMNEEYQSLMEGIDNIYNSVKFNEKKLINQNIEASANRDKINMALPSDIEYANDMHVTGGTDPANESTLQVTNHSTSDQEAVLAKGKTLRETNLLTQEDAQEANDILEQTLKSVSYCRGGIGANMNVLDYSTSELENAILNAIDALSEIEDVDMAEEMMNLTKGIILQQAAQAVATHTMASRRAMISMILEM